MDDAELTRGYACIRGDFHLLIQAGWWGFAALNTSDEKLKYNGEEKDIEIGAVIWVEFHDWKEQ